MNKNYRIHTNISSDSLLQVNMRQDFDFMEILSLKLSQKDAYKIHSSNYGVIIGRVLANDAFGIPNAKVSVFIERDDSDTTELENIYPYTDITTKDKEGRRYNLLPDYSDDECYRIVGTFPNKRLLLDDTTYLEVYDKYWKYSTVTNNAGDYMIFGVPTGSQQIHVDIDMSDIGVLSQKPRDYMYKGYTETLFDSSTQFKSSTNLDNLTQIFSQNKSVYVYPFWGDAENGIAAITRADIQINYKFEPTCVFMGSIISDNDGNNIDHKCGSTMHSGFNRQLVAGEGTIEMIRKTQDGLVEEYPIQGNRLIDSDGVWCYQIPMNLDFVGTDEYGNIIPTDNPSKGIPTRTQVRFRISKNETGGEGFSRHTAKYLVPMNPVLDETQIIPTTREESGQEMEKMYVFGSNTPQSCFRDLYWNNVYSVKNFIPKTQVARRAYSPYYNALKSANSVDNQNPLPFNKLMINIPFTYMFICLLFTIVVYIIYFINHYIINPINELLSVFNSVCRWDIWPVGRIFDFLCVGYLGCISMQAGPNAENKVFYPGCNQLGMDHSDCPDGMDSCNKENDEERLIDIIQQNLSQEYDVVRLDLYQDWLNGSLYMPLWFWKKSKKKKFLFWTIRRAKNEFCNCDKRYSRLKTRYTCNIRYNTPNNGFDSLSVNREALDPGENGWHNRRERGVWFENGLIKGVENQDGLTAYYYTAFQPSSNDEAEVDDIKQRKNRFEIVRLFATDIILLGNLNESNIYGIPQLFNNLPSTTSNVPPIATIEESNEVVDESKENVDNALELAQTEDGGTTITTGMDWGYKGADDSPIYKNGLFLDLGCFAAYTRAKACINVERLSELGVGLDMSYKMEYGKGNDLIEGIIDSDGFVNKFEINDNNTRAMFATLNHVGFIPQDYQLDKEMYETQVMDENTGYLVPKFKYTYPVDFDGRMQPIMEDYENGFAQPLFDAKDESYITFRLGAEGRKSDKDKPKHGRIRHFYYYENDKLEMPLYNNSFYFYFGINKGNTAIDKFYTKFVAPCKREEKKPFSIDINTQGKIECRCMYRIPEYRDPYIEVTMDDIQSPYSYQLFDGNSNQILLQTGQTATTFRIPDTKNKETSGVEITNQSYTIKVTDGNGKKLSERILVETPKVSISYETERLGTKFYNIDSTRVDYICNDDTMFYGKLRVKSFTIDGYPFNISNIEPIGYDDTTNSYIVRLTGVNNLKDNDVNVFYNGDNLDASDEECICEKTLEPTKNLNQVILSVSVVENKTSQASSSNGGAATTNGVRNCLCDRNNPVAITQGASATINIGTALETSQDWLGMEYVIPKLDEENYYKTIADANAAITEYNTAHQSDPGFVPLPTDGSIVFKVAEFYAYQPNTFLLTVSQWCDNQIVSSNTTSEMAIIQNGENFNAYLNDMPVRFMTGTINDSQNGDVANKSNFYRTTAVQDPNKDGLNGWLGVHQEDTYKFPATDNKNKVIWQDYITLKNDISHPDAKKKILKYKFETMFSVAEAAYVTEDSSVRFTYHAKGGVGVPLNRTAAPVYDSSTLGATNPFVKYSLTDRTTVNGDSDYPNIVGINYRDHNSDKGGPYLNKFFKNDYKLQGNYFAVFSNNGGYDRIDHVDETIPVIKLPNFTKVTPTTDGTTKKIGKDIKNKNITDFRPVYQKEGQNLPYLRAMFVDRRLDYMLQILAPSTGQNIRLYPTIDENGFLGQTVTVGDKKYDKYGYYNKDGGAYVGDCYKDGDDFKKVSDGTVIDPSSYDFKLAGNILPVYKYYKTEDNTYVGKCFKDGNNYVAEDGTVLSTTDYTFKVSKTNSPKEKVWKGGRISGTTYGGIEMSYDDETMSIISADTNDDFSKADKNNKLEYSYNYSDAPGEDAKTYFNENPEVPRRLYEADLNGVDIRDMFWSNARKQTLTTLANSPENNLSNGNIYFYKYPATTNGIYNGDFTRKTAIYSSNNTVSNYPTKRYIDVGNLPMVGGYSSLVLSSCGYDMKPVLDSKTGELQLTAARGETLEYEFTFQKPITMMQPSAENETFGNINYRYLSTTSDGYLTLTADTLTLMFKLNTFDSNGFDVYTQGPKVLRVLPGKDGVDGISYYKTITNKGNEDTIYKGKGTINKTLHNRNRDLILYHFHRVGETASRRFIFGNITADTITSENVEYRDEYHNSAGEEVTGWFLANKDSDSFLDSNANEINNITFYKVITLNSDVKIFTIVIEREFESRSKDNLRKHISTVETSDLYDSRPILLGIDADNSYVQMIPVGVDSQYNSNSEEEEDPDNEPPTVDSTGQTHIQTISFKTKFSLTADPVNAQCEAFSDFSTMSYTFIFTNARGDSYTLYPTDVMTVDEETTDEVLVVRMKVKWSQDMGIMADDVWVVNTNVTILGKTKDNFVYKISDLKFKFGGFTDTSVSYDPPSRTSTGMVYKDEEGKDMKYITRITFVN